MAGAKQNNLAAALSKLFDEWAGYSIVDHPLTAAHLYEFVYALVCETEEWDGASGSDMHVAT